MAIVEHSQHGLFGGYLVLNCSGRPLEFHCTAPVKPNRAQQILYGPTLEPFLYGEQIGQTLASKSKLQVPVILVDAPASLALRDHVTSTVACVLPAPQPQPAFSGASPEDRTSVSHAGLRLTRFQIGQHTLAISAAHQNDQASLIAALEPLTGVLDFTEPFERIREAIQEANKAA